MHRRTALVLALAVFHFVVTAIALTQVSFVDIFRVAFTDWAGAQVFSDLSVSLVLISVWMIKDGRERGLSAWPFVLAMLPLGSFAWMAYLAVRQLRAPAGVLPGSGLRTQS